jgi:hypothetical protein
MTVSDMPLRTAKKAEWVRKGIEDSHALVTAPVTISRCYQIVTRANRTQWYQRSGPGAQLKGQFRYAIKRERNISVREGRGQPDCSLRIERAWMVLEGSKVRQMWQHIEYAIAMREGLNFHYAQWLMEKDSVMDELSGGLSRGK